MTRTGNILTELVPRFEKPRGEVATGKNDKAATGDRSAEKSAFGNLVKNADGKAEASQTPGGKVDRAAKPALAAAETVRTPRRDAQPVKADAKGGETEVKQAKADVRPATPVAVPAGPDADTIEAIVARHAAREVRQPERPASPAPIATRPDSDEGEIEARPATGPSRPVPARALPIVDDTGPRRQEPAADVKAAVPAAADGAIARAAEPDLAKVAKVATPSSPEPAIKAGSDVHVAAPTDDTQPVEMAEPEPRAEPSAERQPRNAESRQAVEATFVTGARDDAEPVIERQQPDNAAAARQAPAEPAVRRQAEVAQPAPTAASNRTGDRTVPVSTPIAATDPATDSSSQAATGVANTAAGGAATVILPRTAAAVTNGAARAPLADVANETPANGATVSLSRAAALPAPAAANAPAANAPTAPVPPAAAGLVLGPVIRSEPGTPQNRAERAPPGTGSQPAPRETVTVLASRGPEMNARLVQEAASAQRALGAQGPQAARNADDRMPAIAAEPEMAPNNARTGAVRQEMPVAAPSPATGPANVHGQLVQSLTAPDGLARAAQELRLLATQPGATPTPEPLKVLHIQLQPRDLGDVAVRIALRGDKLELRVQTARQATANLLMSDQRLLVEALQQKNFDIDTVTVQLVEPDRNSAAQSANLSNAPQGRGGQNESFLSGSQGQASRQNNGAGRDGGSPDADRRDQRQDLPDGNGQRRGIYL